MKMLLLALTLVAGFAAQAGIQSNDPKPENAMVTLPCGKKVPAGLFSNTIPSPTKPIQTVNADPVSAVK